MKPTIRQRIRYTFDNLMSRGTPALIGVLFVVSLAVVFIAGAAISISGFVQEGGSGPLPFSEAVWESLMHTADFSTMSGDTGAGYRGVMLLVTLGGIFAVSSLIGVLSNGLDTQISNLRKGRSLVLESNHTLLLGWSSEIFTVLNELAIAYENQGQPRIVVLADKDKVEMEDEIRERVSVRGKMRIICRSGQAIDPKDLEIASPQRAKSIIVLPSEGEDPDTEVIKTVLAITNSPTRRPEPYHIVTQIRHPKNMDVLKMVGAKDKVQIVLTGDLIARIVTQTSRQSGLSLVYTELMEFGGDEMYFKNEIGLVGKSFGDALLAYEDSCLMGLRKANGDIRLNPPMDVLVETGDEIFALSQDDGSIRLSGIDVPPVEKSLIRARKKPEKPKPSKCLILGWNPSGANILQELDHYVAPGSQVTVVADIEDFENNINAQGKNLKHQKLKVTEGDTSDRDLLNKLKVQDYDHVIVLAYSNLPAQEADAKTLVTLLHLRNMAEHDQTPFSIVSEVLDLRNRELAYATKVDDFIVSEQLVSLMMSQFSENADLFDVFADILDRKGSEIYLNPISDYVATGQPVNFYSITAAASQRGETAIGYRISSESSEAGMSYGVHTNPKKSEMVTFSPEDRVIVIAKG